ncbi:MAG: ATP-dependent DNA helicase RecQ [Lachnospiraceae bacterium]|nr:ATP-dependent DNA helicase RecQ [Lachnospiraceae bacterium]
MKRFSPYVKYKMNGEIRYSSIGPDGKREDSPHLNDERIMKIRSMFPPRFRLRGRQEEIMRSILSGKDTFVVLPTGSGKSLCFQAPSVFFPGITLVITPLIALMENQVHNFNEGHYPRYHSAQENRRQVNYYENLWFKAIYPGMDGLSLRAMFSEIQNPQKEGEEKRQIQYKLLYVSPERLCDQRFLRALKEAEGNGLKIPHVVIDEVHCMSQWGFDFRESYLHIAGFIRQRPVRPIISAFTATATPKDRAEIKNLLGFPVILEEYDKRKYEERFYVERRNNLLLCVERCSDYDRGKEAENTQPVPLKTRKDRLMEILTENPTKVCIIYRTTVTGVNELYDILREKELLRDRLVKYHAQMPEKEKRENKNGFLKSYDEEKNPERKSRSASEPCKNILIATKAFGMGIDKNDISLVIHYDMPRSLEDYYQEVGRAGRDTKRVPKAKCYLLYAGGPQKEKGTLQYTIQWVLSEKGASDFRCLPISPQFSRGMREHIYFWSYYRLCYMRTYCEYALQYPHAAQNFIIRYLDNKFSIEQAIRELDAFYKYIVQHYQISDVQREGFLEEHLIGGAAACRFLSSSFGQEQQKPDAYHKELRKLMNEVNELHINNTYMANLLRDHPNKYQLNQPYLSEKDPDCGLDKKELMFTIWGDEKLSYFDMCVLDAIYSIEISQERTVYVQTIWEILTGRNPHYSSQEKGTFRKEIQNSIDKMRSMTLSVFDQQCNFTIERQCFLPLRDKPKGQKGYGYSAIPPLFRYAEEKNGQIIKVPVSLFHVAKIGRSTLWKKDWKVACDRREGGREALDEGSRHAFDYYVKYLPQDLKYEPKIKELLNEREYAELEGLRKRTYRFSPSLDNALLCHYLIRRIAISKRRKRGNFIQFSTIREITHIRDDACLLHKKAAAVMDHYQRIGYLKDYNLYITNYVYELTDGGKIVGPAFFQVQTMAVIKYWQLHGMNHLLLSDFLVSWSGEYKKELSDDSDEGGNLCADTRRRLALVSLEQVDGMVLRYE